MGKYKTRVRLYAAWNYQREIDDLNKMSEKGWQLVKGGAFSGRFKRDESVKYRYQLDYQPKIDDRPRYIESFREFGWEYVNSTFNGWHYFRKAYDPSLPEEEYEIFSDRDSLKEMNNRWAKLAIVLTVFSALYFAIELALMTLRPMLPTLLMLVAYAVILTGFIRGIVLMKNPDRSKNSGFDRVFIILFIVLIFGGIIGGNVLRNMRPNDYSSMTAEYMEPISAENTDAALLWNTAEIKYCDNYYIDVEIKADSFVTINVISEDGEVVYSVSGDNVCEEDVKLRLDKGEYKIYLSNFAGGAMEVYFDLE